jgi:hypothetical protein
VFFNVVDGFLHDAKQVQFHHRRQALRVGNELALKLQIGPQLHLAAEAGAGGGQAQMVEVGGPQVVRDPAVLLQNFHQQPVAAVEDFAGGGLEVGIKPG